MLDQVKITETELTQKDEELQAQISLKKNEIADLIRNVIKNTSQLKKLKKEKVSLKKLVTKKTEKQKEAGRLIEKLKVEISDIQKDVQKINTQLPVLENNYNLLKEEFEDQEETEHNQNLLEEKSLEIKNLKDSKKDFKIQSEKKTSELEDLQNTQKYTADLIKQALEDITKKANQVLELKVQILTEKQSINNKKPVIKQLKEEKMELNKKLTQVKYEIAKQKYEERDRKMRELRKSTQQELLKQQNLVDEKLKYIEQERQKLEKLEKKQQGALPERVEQSSDDKEGQQETNEGSQKQLQKDQVETEEVAEEVEQEEEEIDSQQQKQIEKELTAQQKNQQELEEDFQNNLKQSRQEALQRNQQLEEDRQSLLRKEQVKQVRPKKHKKQRIIPQSQIKSKGKKRKQKFVRQRQGDDHKERSKVIQRRTRAEVINDMQKNKFENNQPKESKKYGWYQPLCFNKEMPRLSSQNTPLRIYKIDDQYIRNLPIIAVILGFLSIVVSAFCLVTDKNIYSFVSYLIAVSMMFGYLPLQTQRTIKPAFLITVLIFFSLLIWANFIQQNVVKPVTILCALVAFSEGFFGLYFGLDGYTVLSKENNHVETYQVWGSFKQQKQKKQSLSDIMGTQIVRRNDGSFNLNLLFKNQQRVTLLENEIEIDLMKTNYIDIIAYLNIFQPIFSNQNKVQH